MNEAGLFRLAGAAAITGGLLRMAGSYADLVLVGMALQIFYFAIDVFLIFALTGIYLHSRKSAGGPGLLGFVIAVIGILLVRSSAVLGGYALAAALTLIGTVILGAAMLRDRANPRWPAFLWIASLVIGVAGMLIPAFEQATAFAGVAFGAGFVLAGAHLSRAA